MGDFEDGRDAGARPSRAAVDGAPNLGVRLVLAILYSCLVVRIVTHMEPESAAILSGLSLLLSEGLVVFALLRRPAIEISRRPGDWILAAAATLAPFLVGYPDRHPRLSILFGSAVLWLFGFIAQDRAKIIIGRSFGCLPAHYGLELAELYRYIRHPMYAGYTLSNQANLIMNPTLRNPACSSLAAACRSRGSWPRNDSWAASRARARLRPSCGIA